MNYSKFTYPISATDIVILTIIDEKLKVLLIKMKKEPYADCWATPGKTVAINESVDDSARKTLLLQTGIDNVYLEQLYTFGRVDRDPFGRVVSTAYFALIPANGIDLKTSDEYDGVQWYDINGLPRLAYDHSELLQYAKDRLKAKLEYTNIVCNLLPSEFAFSDLQKTYEIILERKIDKRNFRKKINALKIIKKTGKMTEGSAHRPASLYKFKSTELRNIEIM